MSRKLTIGEDANIMFLLVCAYRWFERALRSDPKLRKTPDLTLTQLMLFAYMHPGGSRISDLARRLDISRQAVHQAVQGLVAAGLMEVKADPHDRRAKLVRLTRRGSANDRRAVDAIWRLEKELQRRIGSKTRWALRDALEADWGPPPGFGENGHADDEK